MDYDDDFMFLNEGNDAAEEAPAPSNEVRKVNVNSKGQKVRGKDLTWIPVKSFTTVLTYKESEEFQNLQSDYTLKRRTDTESGDIEYYIFRYSRRLG